MNIRTPMASTFSGYTDSGTAILCFYKLFDFYQFNNFLFFTIIKHTYTHTHPLSLINLRKTPEYLSITIYCYISTHFSTKCMTYTLNRE